MCVLNGFGSTAVVKAGSPVFRVLRAAELTQLFRAAVGSSGSPPCKGSTVAVDASFSGFDPSKVMCLPAACTAVKSLPLPPQAPRPAVCLATATTPRLAGFRGQWFAPGGAWTARAFLTLSYAGCLLQRFGLSMVWALLSRHSLQGVRLHRASPASCFTSKWKPHRIS